MAGTCVERLEEHRKSPPPACDAIVSKTSGCLSAGTARQIGRVSCPLVAPEALESQLQELREQLDLQAEAISKLAELVSNLDGVDAAQLGSYLIRLKKRSADAVAAPKVEVPAADTSASPGEPSAPATT